MNEAAIRQKIVLGVKINDVSLEQASQIVENWLNDDKKRYIVTPNPEFIVKAQDDSVFRQVLNTADLAIPDGVGLKLLSDVENNSPGVDLMQALCKRAFEKGYTVGLLGGSDGVAEEAAECLQKKFPKLKIAFAQDGPIINESGKDVGTKNQESGDKVQNLDSKTLILPTDILFVGFGQVKQEKWIANNLAVLPVKVAMGVGGSFDYISGRVSRAPEILRKLGLEWLFRLYNQPWRIKRQLRLVKFVWLILLDRVRN